jgi:hypothetical protein
MLASFSTSSQNLWKAIGGERAPQLFDVRPRDIFDAARHHWPAQAA